MVWGMAIPTSFGEFWPDGNFEGIDKSDNDLWGERLRLYYLAQPAEEQRRLYDYGDHHVGHGAGNYASYVTGKFKSELGTRAPGKPVKPIFTLIQPHEAPRSFVTEKNYAILGSLIALNFGLLAVDKVLKAIIERIEPDVHQFFPIEIQMPGGKVYSGKYYTLVIGEYIDSFLTSKSKQESWKDYGPEYPDVYSYKDSSKGISGLALNQAKIRDAHLWRERSFTSILVCFSDALAGRIANAELRIPKHYKMMEV